MSAIAKHCTTHRAETPREESLATLLGEALPYLVTVELGTKTSGSLRLLIKLIKDEVHGK